MHALPRNPARRAFILLAAATLSAQLGLATEILPAAQAPMNQGAAAEAVLTVILRQEVTCASDKLTVAELAALSGPGALVQTLGALDLGKAPAAGKSRIVTRSELESVLTPNLPAGLKLSLAGAQRVSVSGPGALASGEEIAQTAIEAIRGELAVYPGMEAAIEVLKQPAPVAVPSLPVEFRPDLTGLRLGTGLRTVRVVILQDNIRVGESRVTLQVRFTQQAAVASAKIAAGEQLSDGNVEIKSQEIASLATWRPAPFEDLRGKRARQQIPAGRVIETSMLELIPAIEKGDRVTVLLSKDGMELSTEAEAVTGANLGQQVRLRLLINGKEVVARTTGPGRAQL